jgi:hypothetical protein
LAVLLPDPSVSAPLLNSDEVVALVHAAATLTQACLSSRWLLNTRRIIKSYIAVVDIVLRVKSNPGLHEGWKLAMRATFTHVAPMDGRTPRAQSSRILMFAGLSIVHVRCSFYKE